MARFTKTEGLLTQYINNSININFSNAMHNNQCQYNCGIG